MPRSQQKGSNAPAKSAGDITKKKKRKAVTNGTVYASYLQEVAKMVPPEEVGLSGKASRALSGLIANLEESLTNDAKRMSTLQKSKTIKPSAVQVALATRLPRGLTEGAGKDASNAVDKYTKSQGKAKVKKNGISGK